MGKLIVNANTSLDGVIEDPTGEEGSPSGGWFQLTESDRAEWTKVELAEALEADALLFGRLSYEWFASRWQTRTGEWADRLRSMPKYVLSSTLTDPTWGNSTVVSGDAVTVVSKLKDEVAGDIVLYGSFQLGQVLMEHDVVDELRLIIYPFVVGAGRRFFGRTSAIKPMRLAGAETIGEALTFLTYRPVREAGSD